VGIWKTLYSLVKGNAHKLYFTIPIAEVPPPVAGVRIMPITLKKTGKTRYFFPAIKATLK
jgi:hypothetical protein